MRLSYGSTEQVNFPDSHEYYYALGLLASARRTSINWEHNEEQGAWGPEGRIHVYADLALFSPYFAVTAGTGRVLGRINCNDYVSKLVNRHNFAFGAIQNIPLIMSTVPRRYQGDFVRGLAV